MSPELLFIGVWWAVVLTGYTVYRLWSRSPEEPPMEWTSEPDIVTLTESPVVHANVVQGEFTVTREQRIREVPPWMQR